METKIGKPKQSCACDACKRACEYKPGWFIPSEAEGAAVSVGMEFDRFFKTYLGIDYWEAHGRTVYLLAPATAEGEPGAIYPDNPRGRCRLLDEDGHCMIYAARPFECREYHHDDLHETVIRRHRGVMEAWEDHQDWILDLLIGRHQALDTEHP